MADQPIETKAKTTTFNISPGAGIMINERWMLGTLLDYGNTWYESANNQNNYFKTRLWSTSISPFVRNFTPIFEKFYFTTTCYAGMSLGSNTSGDTKQRTTSLQISVGPGLAYQLNERWMITASLGNISYRYAWIKTDNSNNISDFKTTDSDFSFNLHASNFGLGVRYFMKNKAQDNKEKSE